MCTFRQWPFWEWHSALAALLEITTLKSQPPVRLPTIPPEPRAGWLFGGGQGAPWRGGGRAQAEAKGYELLPQMGP